MSPLKSVPTLLAMTIIILSGCNQSTGSDSQKTEVTLQKPFTKDSLPIPSEPDSGVNIYLTFDDGPYMTTPRLTKFLNDRSIKSSFFIVGSQIDHSHAYDSVFNHMKTNPNFKLYNHTYSHAVTKGRLNNYYKHPESVWDDILKNKSFGFSKNNITRLPGTNAFRFVKSKKMYNDNSKRLIRYLDSIGSDERIFGWDFEWTLKHSRDSVYVNKLFHSIKKTIETNKEPSKNYVILLHDYLFRDDVSLSNLSQFITILKKEYNCKFKWAEEYPNMN